MPQKLQQVLIGCILIGTFVYFATEVFTTSYSTPSKKKAEVNSPTPEPTESSSECLGPYLNVNEGATWNYTITSSEASSDKKIPTPKSDTAKIAVSLTKKEPGRLTFTTTDAATTQTSSTHVTCRMSGLYGLPIFSPIESIDLIPQGLVEEIFSQVLFIPNRRVYKGTAWTSTINIASFLPIKMDSTPLGLAFNVQAEEVRNIQGKKYGAVQIQSSTDSKSPIDLGSLFDATYTLGENVGLIEAHIRIKVPTKGSYAVKISLQKFSNPL